MLPPDGPNIALATAEKALGSGTLTPYVELSFRSTLSTDIIMLGIFSVCTPGISTSSTEEPVEFDSETQFTLKG